MFYVIMRSLIIVILICNVFVDGKSTKKPKDENLVLNKKLTGKSTKTQPAIIAIEIVDPNENSTTSKNTKRTIGGSLGYGYQNDFNTHPPPPRYEVYKYSQHDIPPYPINNQYNQPTNQYNVQESISYQLPENNQNGIERFYQPGTTLFSTINNQGHIDGLSTQLPQQYDPQVPVIILKVYPSQLTDSGASLHANLPQTHPLAAMVNSIDIQALLSKYVHNMLINQNYQQQQQQYQHDGLLTDENYPKDTHTRIIFRDNKIQPQQMKIVQSGYNSVPQMEGYYYNLQQNQEPVVQSYYYQQQEQPQQQQQQYYQNEQYNYEQAPQTQQQNYLQNYQDYSETGGFAPPPPSPSSSQNYQYDYQENIDEVKPHNYHAHPKRSQRAKNSRGRPFRLISQPIIKDIKQLNPIK